MSGDPQAEVEARTAARHLLAHPMTCAEQDPEAFRLIRRHAATLDRWFTQRFGDRVHVDADTARLHKSVPPLTPRPLATGTGRALRPVEYTMLALALASVASGPDVISLRDLVAAVQTAAAEAEIDLTLDAPDRRSLVTALQWMITQGLLVELHDHVDRYGADGDADAVLRIRADRIALIARPGLGDATSAEDLVQRAHQRGTTRQHLRAALANDPVLYRTDVSPEVWAELRRRLGEESAVLDEMFGLELEARAEGVATIDPRGGLSDRPFPGAGTESHAALLLIDRLVEARSAWAENDGMTDGSNWHGRDEVADLLASIAVPHARRWRRDLVERPDRLADLVVGLLVDLRLARREVGPEGTWRVRLLPAAARFTAAPLGTGAADPAEDPASQATLW